MDTRFENLLLNWPLAILKDVDISMVISESASRRYALVNRAIKKEVLIPLRRGLYLIGKPYRKTIPSNFELAFALYGPSYISFESALGYHQWIPEAVYQARCATAKRSKEFNTPLGVFEYIHVPEYLFYLGTERIGKDYDAFFIASPWKALADHVYAFNRGWNSLEDIELDMRIEKETLLESDLNTLKILAENYQSVKVRKFLNSILKELTHGNQSY